MKKNNKGQMAVEMVLILSMLFIFVTIVSTQFRSQELVKNIVSGPWKVLSGMLQNGVWATPEDSMIQHPNAYNRHLTYEGEKP